MIEVNLKKRIPEANIQAEIYHRLKLEGVSRILEYKHLKSRFDIMILEEVGERAFAKGIIEVKSWAKKGREPKWEGAQLQKYGKLGLPVLVCGRWEEIEDAVQWAKGLQSLLV